MLDIFTVEVCGDIATTPDFWDCECLSDYIKPKCQAYCSMCGAYADDSPDSRAYEVLADMGVQS